MRRTMTILATTLALALAGGATAAPAQATTRHPAPGSPTPVTAANLLTPLSVATGRGSSVLFSQNFSGTLSRTDARGTVRTVYQSRTPGAEVGAVSYRFGTTFFVENTGAGPEPAPNTGLIRSISGDGKVRTLADVAVHEARRNPDGNVRYGFRDVSASCRAQLPAAVPGAYRGEVDSHPYATEPVDPPGSHGRRAAAVGHPGHRGDRRGHRPAGLHDRSRLLLRAGADGRQARLGRLAPRLHPAGRPGRPGSGRPGRGVSGGTVASSASRPACSRPPASRSARAATSTWRNCSPGGSR